MIDVPRCIGRTKGGLNSKLHAIVDAAGRPVMMCLTEGQTSEHIGAKILYPALPDETQAVMIADKGYDSDQYRTALKAKGITACIPSRKGRKSPASYCKACINNVIRSKTCLDASKTGDVWQPDMTDVHTHILPVYSLQLSLYTEFNEF